MFCILFPGIPPIIRIIILTPAFGGFGVLIYFANKHFKDFEKRTFEMEKQLDERRIRLKELSQEGKFLDDNKNGDKVVSEKVVGRLRNLLTSMRSTCQGTLSDINTRLETLDLEGITDEKIKSQISSTESNFSMISNNIKKAFNISDNLANSAEKAFKSSESVQGKIKLVTDALGEALDFSNHLFDQSKKIGKILEIMSEIADKIHVLSINASIVSARAGEQGKAFEVVSREIRKLAFETESSLKDIEGEIVAIREIVDSVVKKITFANTQILQERNSLISVIGSLQGITLGVEVLRAVSRAANEKTLQQGEIISTFVNKFMELHKHLSDTIRIRENVFNMMDVEDEFEKLANMIETRKEE
ncbi:MAG: hypothetical protein JW969_21555 [Spirochaetales bacterium]|nr:hypothetical protein [Spirochaetales bacterium]